MSTSTHTSVSYLRWAGWPPRQLLSSLKLFKPTLCLRGGHDKNNNKRMGRRLPEGSQEGENITAKVMCLGLGLAEVGNQEEPHGGDHVFNRGSTAWDRQESPEAESKVDWP